MKLTVFFCAGILFVAGCACGCGKTNINVNGENQGNEDSNGKEENLTTVTIDNGPCFVAYENGWESFSRPKWTTTETYNDPLTNSSKNMVNAHAGNIIYYDNMYYWFGEYKSQGDYDNGNVHKSKVGVACYSSLDLKNWKFEKIALPVQEGTDIASGQKIERPKVIYNEKTKKFVMWFHVAGANFELARCGCAVSDNITGPYVYKNNSLRPNKGVWPVNVTDYHKRTDNLAPESGYDGGSLPFEIDKAENGNILGRDYNGGQMSRDLGLFVDDDKTAYMIYASEENSTIHISQLSDDYTEHIGKYIRLFPGKFNEAPILFKNNGRYYIMSSGCTGWRPNEARSAVSNEIFGEWKECANPCVGNKSEKTFGGQAASVIKIERTNKFYVLLDIWEPFVYNYENDPRYALLPVTFKNDTYEVQWREQLDVEY